MTSDIVSSVLQWLNTHAEYSWFITFFISAAESIAVIGTIVPGSITMTALGALAGAGIIPLWSTLFWAFLGAVVGDGISYSMGYYFKDRIRTLWPFRNNPQILDKGETFFRRYGGMGVFIGRFIGPIRALIPMVAGMIGMRPLNFLVANVASAAGWAPVYMLPGILIGAASLELPPDIATRVMLILIFWTLFLLLCLWLIRKIPIFTHHQIINLFTCLWSKLQKSSHWRLVKKLFHHYNPEKTPLQLTLVFYLLLMGVILFGLATYIHRHGSDTLFINQSIYHFFRGIYNPEVKNAMIYLTLLGQKEVVLPVAAIIIFWLFMTRRWHIALHGLGLFLLTIASVLLIKHSVLSPRPWGIVGSPESFSFPSGHTTLTTTFYLGLAFLIGPALVSRKTRQFIYGLAVLLILTVSSSRLYLGAHWFTDVLAAWLLSACLLTLITISYNRSKDGGFNARKLLGVTLGALVVIYSLVAYLSVPRLEKNFTQLDLPVQEAEMDTWWGTQNESFLPEWRISMFGFPSQSINIEWVGSLPKIEETLKKAGWETPPARSWIDVLFRLSGIQSAEHLPLISPLYMDKEPVLVLMKYTEDKKLIVLRFYQSNTVIKDKKDPLYVGVVSSVPRTYGWLSRRSKIDIEVTQPLLFGNKNPHVKVRTIAITIPNKKKNPIQMIMLIH